MFKKINKVENLWKKKIAGFFVIYMAKWKYVGG